MAIDTIDRTKVDAMKDSKSVDPQAAEMERLRARVAELEAQAASRIPAIWFKVGEKGTCSVYGLGKFPVSLYYEQWILLLDAADRLRAFLKEQFDAGKLKGPLSR